MLFALLGGAAYADGYGYIVDFNTPITTSSHDFILGSNWGHVVGTDNYDNYGPYYMNYSYTSDGGYNNTGSLCANRQYAEGKVTQQCQL